ncbi:sec-independent protein translocase protein TatB [Microbacterium sp. SORGH_AS 505]|uniref:Sec-independent protein translocase TatB n=1 Tax=Microbacterium sp. SORGH_AS_0505 TaxID=3041770 RepID=UPI00278008EE|nr:Sec-independent protein translocase TatB [Microbacterium sp. SORGH_AS_0505]MDQ1127669.1 sec-independent protein translocase protein TatB [Microbacterium sp. SORGH_AS_0505]
MSFGLDLEKILLIGLIAALLLGPERLPGYAASLARLTRRVREWLDGARTRVKEEMGDDFDEIEWRKLDPRQYDPRRIIREALIDDAPVKPVSASPAAAVAVAEPLAGVEETDAAPETPSTVPFDSEAT